MRTPGRRADPESTVNNAEAVEEESFSRLMCVLESQVSVG
jgi:hypothetical protein